MKATVAIVDRRPPSRDSVLKEQFDEARHGSTPPVTPAVKKWRPKDRMFKAGLGYIVSEQSV